MTSLSVSITLPFPPSVNCLFAGKKRRYPSAAYRRWRQVADMTVMAARVPQVAGPVSISVQLHASDKRPRDADNYLKSLIDCAVRMRVIEADDNRIVRDVRSSWGEQRRTAVAVVTITPIA